MIISFAVDLLTNTTEFIDKLMETDEDICVQWSTADLVLAVMEAVKQTGLVADLKFLCTWCSGKE